MIALWDRRRDKSGPSEVVTVARTSDKMAQNDLLGGFFFFFGVLIDSANISMLYISAEISSFRDINNKTIVDSNQVSKMLSGKLLSEETTPLMMGCIRGSKLLIILAF